MSLDSKITFNLLKISKMSGGGGGLNDGGTGDLPIEELSES